jgi:diadenylate cyclase
MVGVRDILDMLLVAALVYQGYLLVNGTRAVNVVRGVLIFATVWLLSSLLHLSALNYLLGRAGTVGLFALVVVFQPELRGALERLGRPRSRGMGSRRSGRGSAALLDLSRAAERTPHRSPDRH